MWRYNPYPAILRPDAPRMRLFLVKGGRRCGSSSCAPVLLVDEPVRKKLAEVGRFLVNSFAMGISIALPAFHYFSVIVGISKRGKQNFHSSPSSPIAKSCCKGSAETRTDKAHRTCPYDKARTTCRVSAKALPPVLHQRDFRYQALAAAPKPPPAPPGFPFPSGEQLLMARPTGGSYPIPRDAALSRHAALLCALGSGFHLIRPMENSATMRSESYFVLETSSLVRHPTGVGGLGSSWGLSM